MKNKIKQIKEEKQYILPEITTKQKLILYFIYQFRFLHTNHIQKLLNHKNPKRIQVWLKDLLIKGYINRHNLPNTFENHTKPAIYYLSLMARKKLKKEKGYDLKALHKLSRESKRTQSYINYCLTLADIYLFFLLQLKKNESLKFFTESQLLKYEFFPHPLPSAYISVKSKGKIKRFFLELFKDYAPLGVILSRLHAYVDYLNGGNWQENTNAEPFPIILFICPSEDLRKNTIHSSRAIFTNEYIDNISVYIASKQSILNNNSEIWEKVEAE